MIRKGAALVGLILMSPVIAQPVIVESGHVHLRGQLVNGGCAVATESQDLRVLMGQCTVRIRLPVLAASLPSAFHFRYG